MSKLAFHLDSVARVVLLAILLSGTELAQSGPQPSLQQDTFASVRDSLNDAADKALATALAQRAWMKAPEAGMGGMGPPSSDAAHPVVRIRAAVERVRQLQPIIEPILYEEGVPAEFTAVVLVESGGVTTALSPKGARGIWQFMPDTARRYGLAVSEERDERVDVTKSTRAAARYLHDLYLRFGDWPLALAAYNAGERAVGLAMSRMGQREFSGIQSALPQETGKYVPAVWAAMSRLRNQDIKKSTHVIYAASEPAD